MSQRRNSRVVSGIIALSISLVALMGLTFIPTPYVIQQPGPVYDTLGNALSADGAEVPLIEVDGAQVFPTGGTLDLTTVQVVGNRQHPPTWFQLMMAWLDRTRAVVPIDTVFPEGVTSDERDQQNAALMVDSQHEATAAALTELGYDVGATVQVVEALEGSPADGALDAGDTILAIDGTAVDSATRLRDAIQEAEGDEVELTVVRGGETTTVSLTPEETEDAACETVWLIGITLTTDYDFPIDVKLQLDNVGGPSAGMMFALGIIDTLTPGELNGGEKVAGTGTIDAAGVVGPIGGIRQKLYGAKDAGAEYFLAPADNCDEVVGHIPEGLQVFRTETLEDSLEILEVIAEDGDTADLATCSASTR
ncbi:PDZ domain-containing protein [Microbacterium sp.]|uniref:YlbL family protein n=1 Tax=Microbacterium sp. TaxID=51671 RepID=UPI00281218F4|nr:PDZ domain-containing protein [Microbacterium sp.]